MIVMRQLASHYSTPPPVSMYNIVLEMVRPMNLSASSSSSFQAGEGMGVCDRVPEFVSLSVDVADGRA